MTSVEVNALVDELLDGLELDFMSTLPSQGLKESFVQGRIARATVALQCVFIARVFRRIRHRAMRYVASCIVRGTMDPESLNFAQHKTREDPEKVVDEVEWSASDEEEGEKEVHPGDPALGGLSWRAMTIGIIGCGDVGKQLIELLLQCGDFSPDDIHVSTRSSEKLLGLKEIGVQFYTKNEYVARNADVVFLCCLPVHLKAVAHDIREVLSHHTLVVSVAAGCRADHVSRLLDKRLVLCPLVDVQGLGEVELPISLQEGGRRVDLLNDLALLKLASPTSPRLQQRHGAGFVHWTVSGIVGALRGMGVPAERASSLASRGVMGQGLHAAMLAAEMEAVVLAAKEQQRLMKTMKKVRDEEEEEEEEEDEEQRAKESNDAFGEAALEAFERLYVVLGGGKRKTCKSRREGTDRSVEMTLCQNFTDRFSAILGGLG